jgi:hypothetical protein
VLATFFIFIAWTYKGEDNIVLQPYYHNSQAWFEVFTIAILVGKGQWWVKFQ